MSFVILILTSLKLNKISVFLVLGKLTSYFYQYKVKSIKSGIPDQAVLNAWSGDAKRETRKIEFKPSYLLKTEQNKTKLKFTKPSSKKFGEFNLVNTPNKSNKKLDHINQLSLVIETTHRFHTQTSGKLVVSHTSTLRVHRNFKGKSNE